MKRFAFLPAVVVVCLAVLSSVTVPASAQSSGSQPDDRIVRLVVDNPAAAKVASAAAGGKIVVDTKLFSTVEVPASKADAVRRAARSAGAENVEEDGVSYLLGDVSPFKVIPTDPKYGLLKGLEQMDMPRAWTATKGSASTVIAIVDSGVATVPELQGRVLPGFSAVSGQPARVSPSDGQDDAHGTESAVTAAGAMNNGVANVGSCPECTILPVRVFAQNSLSASNSVIAAGIILAADSEADIISMSLGGPSSTALQDAIAYASSKGKLLIASAGNSGGLIPKYPASYPEVLSVAAIDDSGALYYFSDRGTTVDFAAHGCNWAQDDELRVKEFCGTSSSAPLLSGALALYHTQNPTKTAAQIRSAANAVRTPVDGINGGYINAAQLLGVTPISGSVDSLVSAGPGKVTVAGTVAVEDANTPANLRIYLSGGSTLGTATALGAFSSTVDVATGGAITVCVEATHPSFPGVTQQLGCRSIGLVGGNPVGTVDSAGQSAPGQIRIAGWAIDPDTVDPVSVHVYVDGRYSGAGLANTSRPDVGRAYPGYGDNHGFSLTASASGGTHNICAYAINVGSGNTNPLLGCRSVTVNGGNPVGNFESATQSGPGTMNLSGWALDFDTTSAVQVHVYVDGRWGTAATANTVRTDVGRAYPGYGDNHGFSVNMAASIGTHNVCVYAINIGSGSSNPLLGCRSVTVRGGSPVGNLDVITKLTGTSARISGWALDFDTVNPVSVQVLINGRLTATITANTSRPDIGRAFPGYGDNHGFVHTIAAGAGAKVCLVVVNVGGGTSTPLECKRVP